MLPASPGRNRFAGAGVQGDMPLAIVAIVLVSLTAVGCERPRDRAAESRPPARRPAPLGTAVALPSAPPLVLGQGDVGTAHPTLLDAVAAEGTWTVVCQARTDTDGQGGVAIHVGHHGDLRRRPRGAVPGAGRQPRNADRRAGGGVRRRPVAGDPPRAAARSRRC